VGPPTGVSGLDTRLEIHGRVRGKVRHSVVVASMVVPLRDPRDIGKPAYLAVERAEQRVFRGEEATELPDDESAISDHFDGPTVATRLAEAGDEAKVFGSIVGHERLTIGHARAPKDARMNGVSVYLHDNRSSTAGARACL
jgi:hypothetical protein